MLLSDISSLCTRQNQYHEQRSSRLPSPTHTKIPALTYRSVSFWQSLASHVEFVTPLQETNCCLMECVGQKNADCSHFRTSVTLEFVKYGSEGDSMSDTGSWLLTSWTASLTASRLWAAQEECDLLNCPQDVTVGHKPNYTLIEGATKEHTHTHTHTYMWTWQSIFLAVI